MDFVTFPSMSRGDLRAMRIAIDGAFGTLSEIGHALGDGIPVVGLNTWPLARKGDPENPIIMAHSPVEAVEKALQAAQRVSSRAL